MNRRERLTRAFNHDEMDRPAVYSRTGFPRNDPTYDRLKAYLRETSELKTGLGLHPFEQAWPEQVRTEPVNDDYEREIRTLHTPAGPLTKTSLLSLKGQPGLHETYYLKTVEDAQAYLSLPVPAIAGDVASAYGKARAEVGEAGIVDVSLGRCAGCVPAELYGSETFAMMTITDREVLHALAEHQQKVLMSRLQFCIDAGVGSFFSMAGEEYVAPPLHGPADFDDFIVRYDREVIDRVHDAGGRFHVHCHGPVKKILPGFVESGVDVLHPIESPPLGNCTAAEARHIIGQNITIEGTIQISRMYEATPEEIRQETTQLIEEAFTDSRGPGASPTAPPYPRGEGRAASGRFRARVGAGGGGGK